MDEKFLFGKEFKIKIPIQIYVIAIIMLLLTSLGIAYAFFNANDELHSEALIVVGGKTDCVDVGISSSELELPYDYPITDSKALEKIKPIEVKVTNKCGEGQEDIKYTLTMTTLANNNTVSQIKDFQIKTKVMKQINSGKEEVLKDSGILNNINRINSGNVYALLNDTLSKNTLTSSYQTRNNYVLDVDSIKSNTTNTYKVYLWVDYEEGNIYQNLEINTFNNSTQGKEFKEIFGILTNIEEQGEKVEKEVNEYKYTGGVQTFTPTKDGDYLIELWGASGGDYNDYYGGKGAYTEGIIHLAKNESIYVYVGESGSESSKEKFNGGGPTIGDNYGSTGGGATDIRLFSGEWKTFDGLKSRIMVAAGGGGANNRNRNTYFLNENWYFGAGRWWSRWRTR